MQTIKGLTNLSLIDWDGEVCSVIFVGGCNFRCSMCHNAPLVLQPDSLTTLKEEFVLHIIEIYRKYITGICITGGEPCAQKHLPTLCRKLKSFGLKIKVDTNGKFPLMIDYLLKEKLVDYIAMDIKNILTLDKYSDATNIKLSLSDLEDICLTIDLIKNSGVDYEFRTTVIPTVHSIKDIEQICKYAIKGSKKYAIQNFWNSTELIDPEFQKIKPFSAEALEKFAEVARKYVKSVTVRNLGVM